MLCHHLTLYMYCTSISDKVTVYGGKSCIIHWEPDLLLTKTDGLLIFPVKKAHFYSKGRCTNTYQHRYWWHHRMYQNWSSQSTIGSLRTSQPTSWLAQPHRSPCLPDQLSWVYCNRQGPTAGWVMSQGQWRMPECHLWQHYHPLMPPHRSPLWHQPAATKCIFSFTILSTYSCQVTLHVKCELLVYGGSQKDSPLPVTSPSNMLTSKWQWYWCCWYQASSRNTKHEHSHPFQVQWQWMCHPQWGWYRPHCMEWYRSVVPGKLGGWPASTPEGMVQASEGNCWLCMPVPEKLCTQAHCPLLGGKIKAIFKPLYFPRHISKTILTASHQ